MKNTNLIKLALLSILTLNTAYAAEVPVVKIFSNICGDQKNEVRGSGLVIEYSGEQYVVTSEHVLADPSNKKACVEIQNAAGIRMKTQILVADWSKGLALLKLPANLKNAYAWSPTQSVVQANVGQTSSLVGFRYDSFELNQDNSGSIVSTKNDQMILPGVDSMIEIAHAFGDLAMSGGPLMSEDGTQWLGVLSHNQLVSVPGKKAQLVVGQKDQELILLAIPSDVVQQFLIDTLVNKDLRPEIQRVSVAGSSLERVRLAGLEFTFRPEKPKFFHLAGGGQGDHAGFSGGQGDPAGLSGGQGDPAGIIVAGGGQGDAAGCGGEDDEIDLISGKVSISLARTRPELETKDSRFSKLSWLSEVRMRLIKKSEVSIEQLVKSEENSLKFYGFRSLTRFFSQLKSKNMHPLLERIRQNGAQNQVDQAAKAVLIAVANLEKQMTSQDDKLRFLSQVRNIANTTLQYQWNLVQPSQVAALMSDDTQEIWIAFYAVDMNAGIELRGALNALIEQMRN